MKVLLLNDTSLSPHVGSLAVSAALNRLIALSGGEITHRVYVTEYRELWQGSEAGSIAAVKQSLLASALAAVDAVVLNGEGTLHHDNGLHYLAILAVAQERELKTFLVNSIFEEMTFFPEVIARLDECICRESLSLAQAAKLHPGARMRPDLIVDAEPFWDHEATIDLQGRIVCTDWHPQRTHDIGAMIYAFQRAQPNRFFYPLKHGIHTAIWRSAKANFAGADAVVAARHHGVYLAILAGRPCVMVASNSHKMAALQRMFGKPLVLCESGRALDAAIKRARADANGFRELQARLLALPRSDLFLPLRSGTKNPPGDVTPARVDAGCAAPVRQYQSQPRHWHLQTPESLSLERVLEEKPEPLEPPG